MERPIFDDTQDFHLTSRLAADLGRINYRCDTVLKPFRHLIAGARVLDLGSHNGRMTYAALRLGAAHVLGIEKDAHMAEVAAISLHNLGLPRTSCQFLRQTCEAAIKTFSPGQFDLVLCLGIIYYIQQPETFLANLYALRPRWMVVDSQIALTINSQSHLEECLRYAGFSYRPIRHKPGCPHDYRLGQRVSYLCSGHRPFL